MSTNRDFDRIAARWLAEGPTELADRVLDAALDEVHLTHQQTRHAWRAPRRFLAMHPTARTAFAVLAIVVIGAAVVVALPRLAAIGGPAKSVAPTACILPADVGTVLNAPNCSYASTFFGPALTFKGDPVLAVGLQHRREIALGASQPGSGTGRATEGLDISTVDRLALDPCQPGELPATRPFAATSDATAGSEFFAWLAGQPTVQFPVPHAVMIDGHSGLETTFTLAADSLAACDGRLVFTDTGTETTDTGGFDGLIDGDTWRLAVIGVGGKTVVFATFSPPDRATAIDPPADRLIASVHFK